MANFNRVIILGNLTRDPDYKQLSSGQAVCRLGLASNRQFKSRQTGSLVQEVCYVDIEVWGAQAESCNQYLQKGRAVLVEGRLKFDSWEDPQGQTRNKHLIVADRVLFMPAQNSTEFSAAHRSDEEKNSSSIKNSVDAQLEKELLDQIEQIKSRAQVQKKEAKKEQPAQHEQQNNEKDEEPDQAAFKDEPPFDEELPF